MSCTREPGYEPPFEIEIKCECPGCDGELRFDGTTRNGYRAFVVCTACACCYVARTAKPRTTKAASRIATLAASGQRETFEPWVHVLTEGAPLCAEPVPVSEWDRRFDVWVRFEDADKATCEGCLAELRRISQ